MKVVINRCYGGFGLSAKALARLRELGAPEDVGRYSYSYYKDPRAREDVLLVQVVEELGPEASDKYAKLKVVQIPDDVNYEIEEYDGFERVAEAHRTWS